jgi:hypothetical protein
MFAFRLHALQYLYIHDNSYNVQVRASGVRNRFIIKRRFDLYE